MNKGVFILGFGSLFDLITSVIGVYYFGLTELNFLGIELVILLNLFVVLGCIKYRNYESNKIINGLLIFIGVGKICMGIHNILLM